MQLKILPHKAQPLRLKVIYESSVRTPVTTAAATLDMPYSTLPIGTPECDSWPLFSILVQQNVALTERELKSKLMNRNSPKISVAEAED